MAASSAMPIFPRVVFTILEPISLIGGILSAWLDTDNFVSDQYYPVKSILPHTQSSKILAFQLGNLYGLMALLGLAILNFSSEQRVVRLYIICLALGDIGHIVPTILVLGTNASMDVANWNVMAWGNIGATIILFVTRVGWLFGLFGKPFANQVRKGKTS